MRKYLKFQNISVEVESLSKGSSDFGKTVGCKGCARIAEGVRHTDACHARIEKALDDERIAKKLRKQNVK